jgi:glycyl-tRNA synthetase beta chain
MNISKGFAGGEVDPHLFQEEAEKALWTAFEGVRPEAERSDYVGVFRALGFLRQPIDRFFDDVLVMAEDEKIRNNRLALCWQISQLFRRLADFTLIVQA